MPVATVLCLVAAGLVVQVEVDGGHVAISACDLSIVDDFGDWVRT